MRIALRKSQEPIPYLESDPALAQRLERALIVALTVLALLGLAVLAGVALLGWHILT